MNGFAFVRILLLAYGTFAVADHVASDCTCYDMSCIDEYHLILQFGNQHKYPLGLIVDDVDSLLLPTVKLTGRLPSTNGISK